MLLAVIVKFKFVAVLTWKGAKADIPIPTLPEKVALPPFVVSRVMLFVELLTLPIISVLFPPLPASIFQLPFVWPNSNLVAPDAANTLKLLPVTFAPVLVVSNFLESLWYNETSAPLSAVIYFALP